jgi:hypothetical protein
MPVTIVLCYQLDCQPYELPTILDDDILHRSYHVVDVLDRHLGMQRERDDALVGSVGYWKVNGAIAIALVVVRVAVQGYEVD